jgi:hypothetical protein
MKPKARYLSGIFSEKQEITKVRWCFFSCGSPEHHRPWKTHFPAGTG